MRQRQVSKACPERVGGDVVDHDGLLSINSSSARTGRRADLGSVNGLYIFCGQAGSGAVPQRDSVGIEQENGAEQTAMLFLDVRAEDF
jgi:hypothetical protein